MTPHAQRHLSRRQLLKAGGGGPGLPGASTPSVVSWDLRWSGVTSRLKVRDTTNDFAGEFQQTGAHLDWSMTESGFSFQSDPGGQRALVSFIGHERNGSFFLSLRPPSAGR